MKEFDTDYTDNVVCPYCGHEHDPSEDPEVFYTTNGDSTECNNCGEEFEFSGDVSWTFSSNKIEKGL